MKNYLKYSLGLTLFILVALIAMHWLPVITIDGHTMRRVDLLSDIRTPEPEEEETEADSLPPVPEVKPAFIDTCRTGMTCIEDYSDSTLRGMTPFYRALDEIPMKKRLVRIAVFGDSFIEADIFTADLREMLQKRFGGCGVGFVTITSMTSGYRPTVRHSFGGWSSHAVTDSVYFDRKKQGLSGHYFVPNNNAYVELRGQNKYASLLDTCQQASIFFYNKGAVDLSVRINRGETENRQFEPDGHLQAMQVEGRIGSVRWTVNQADSTLFYGMAMDGTQGIIVDNFSLRGSSGLSLRTIPASIIKEFNEQRPYDLVILQYGLNVATQRGYNYDNYQKGLLTAIEHLKECFPQAGFLLLSVGDRDYKIDTGELRTMPGVKNLIRYQQNIAAESGIAFWNMFEAMGGEGSMAKLVHAKPSMANYDYTHINFRGGKHLAGLLYETLLYGKEQYDRRRAYENK
ncbi:SGNH/GDSL hydrolase family protein [Bacteroides nordii]|uniref:SGNH/GDSL hydrolase family protein n=1 Tax=Bacteroides nordii TaxID=291645 RepID=UPI0034A1D532